jgi:hypothetical protein
MKKKRCCLHAPEIDVDLVFAELVELMRLVESEHFLKLKKLIITYFDRKKQAKRKNLK